MSQILSGRIRAPIGPWQSLIPAESATFLIQTGLLSPVAGLSFDLTEVTSLGDHVRIGFEGRDPIVVALDGQILKYGRSGRTLVASSIDRLDQLLSRFHEHEAAPGTLRMLEDALRAIDSEAYSTFWSDHCRIFWRHAGRSAIEQLGEARTACEAGYWWDAIDIFSGVLLTDPHMVEAYLGRAQALSAVGEHGRASNDIEAARVLSSEFGSTSHR